MPYQKFEVVFNGNLVNNKWLNRPCTNEELEENVKDCLLDSCGYPDNLAEQITVKLLERKDD